MTDERVSYKKIEIHKLFDKADELFKDHVTKPELKMHCIEVEVIMRELAKELGKNEEEWAIAGRLHDLDYEGLDWTNEQAKRDHGRLTAHRLKKFNFPQEILHAIQAHNEENTLIKRENTFDYCLSAADNISGLIYAYALMRGGLQDMTIKGLKKKMKDRTFAANVRRDLITDIEKADIELSKFLELAIKAMQKISEKIGFEPIN
ncbi:HDIG domain-containing protein [Candidatus Pacearchaeota archaeon]|nr:HDIG domain-containing protein [Candidatus Pacearchaeota archaeon]